MITLPNAQTASINAVAFDELLNAVDTQHKQAVHLKRSAKDTDLSNALYNCFKADVGLEKITSLFIQRRTPLVAKWVQSQAPENATVGNLGKAVFGEEFINSQRPTLRGGEKNKWVKHSQWLGNTWRAYQKAVNPTPETAAEAKDVKSTTKVNDCEVSPTTANLAQALLLLLNSDALVLYEAVERADMSVADIKEVMRKLAAAVE